MSDVVTAPQFQPVHIGEEAKPPLAILPDPAAVFAARAKRFRALAPDHQLKGYLEFLATIAEAQAALITTLPPVVLPDAATLTQAYAHAMAPIARTSLPDPVGALKTLDALLEALKTADMPDKAMAALEGVIACDEAERRAMIDAVLADTIPAEEIAEHVYVASAMQVHFSRLAAQLDAEKLTPVADGACPACGGAPVSSSVVGNIGSQSVRFATCSCCATQWHVVRVKCVACSSTKGIHYNHVQGTAETLKAECCDSCKRYLKILYVITDPALDAVADDVASAGLDLLVKEQGFGRAGFNAFLAGF
jgi:FdhE protein